MTSVTLDVSEIQVVILFARDVNGLFWHHRLRLHRTDGGEWVALTPDLELFRHNLSVVTQGVLDRAAACPASMAAQVNSYDLIGCAAIEGLKRQAQRRAIILGEGDPESQVSFLWRNAVPSHSDFGNPIDSALFTDPLTGFAFLEKGVVMTDGDETFVDWVSEDGLGEWKLKRGLGVADVRLYGGHRVRAGERRSDVQEAVALMKAPESAHIHRIFCETFWWMHSYDQLDTSALAFGEHLTRWTIQTEIDVERNSAILDYSGLGINSGVVILPDGHAQTTKFSGRVSKRMSDRAQLWKHDRLFNQERVGGHRGARGRGGGDGSSDSRKRYNVKNKKRVYEKGKGSGGGAGSGGGGGAALAV